MDKYHFSPKYYIYANLATLIATYIVFSNIDNTEQYFYAPFILLGICWALLNYYFQIKHTEASSFFIDQRSTVFNLIKRSAARYLVWLAVFYSCVLLFESPYFFLSNPKTNEFLNNWFQVYLYLGPIYFFITLKFKASRTEDFYDPAVRIIHIIKQIIQCSIGKQKHKPVFSVFDKQYNRKVLLNLLMRGYFIPVMVGQLFPLMNDLLQNTISNLEQLDFFTLVNWAIALLWFAEIIAACAGYCLESRWLENRSKSIDLTAGGWLICLACYPPLNSVTSNIFPFAPMVVTNNVSDLVLNQEFLLYAAKVLELSLLATLVYCDLSLGPSGVNITFKKLQNKGAYAIVRHPATTCKLTFWWMQSMLYLQFWRWEIILGMLGWSVIYILRALSEERHLKHIPEYRQYMQTTRYRFIPGVI